MPFRYDYISTTEWFRYGELPPQGLHPDDYCNSIASQFQHKTFVRCRFARETSTSSSSVWLRAFLPTFSAPAWRKFFHLRKVRDLFEKKCSRARGARIVALTICINSEWAWRAAEKRLIISDSAFGNSLRSGCEINKKADWVIQICLISFEAVARHEQLKCVTMLSWYLKPSPRGKKLA